MMIAWRLAHHCIVHPLMAVLPEQIGDSLHEWTGIRAFPADAACVVVTRGDYVLSVARRGTLSSWGLPGGSIERGERARSAAARELREETGISVAPSALRPIYRGPCGDSVVVTYLATEFDGDPSRGDAGPVAWTTWDELLTGSFADYNRIVRDAALKQLSP